MLKHRYLLAELIKIEITQNYKKSVLGITWLFLLPLLQSAIWLFLKWNGLISTGNIETNYVAFILLSTTLWQLYNYSYDFLGNSISTAIKPLTQGNTPLYIFLIARFVMILFRFSISVFINLIIIYTFITRDINIFSFAIYLLPYIIFCFTVGMLVSMLEVISDDIYILGKEFNKLLYFITPVFYANINPDTFVSKINKFNPLTYLISIPRDSFFNLTLEYKSIYLIISIASITLFCLILFVYVKKARLLIEKIID